jgi:2-polyprenyl-6-methoxyphenol hydroxylase-like FAD-dependent oxidoreductase
VLELGARGVRGRHARWPALPADAVVGCDGVKSVVRERKLIGDAPRVSGHVVYRAVVPAEDMPADLRWNAPVVWAGPNCHLVHYPLRHGEQYNLVVTFHSRDKEEWGVSDGSKEEVLSYFDGVHERPRQLLDRPPRGAAGARPTASRSRTGARARHAAGRCGTSHDAVPRAGRLHGAGRRGHAGRGRAGLRAADGGMTCRRAFRLYASARVARTARVVLSVREMGRLYHAKGVERLVRNSLWVGRTPERFYDAVEWLYDWRPEHAWTRRTRRCGPNASDSRPTPEGAMIGVRKEKKTFHRRSIHQETRTMPSMRHLFASALTALLALNTGALAQAAATFRTSP